MRVVIIYRENADHTRAVEEYLHDIKYQTGHDLEVVNPDTAEGSQFCVVYDIVEYPTIIALSDDGSLQDSWRGLPMPTINELSFYFKG